MYSHSCTVNEWSLVYVKPLSSILGSFMVSHPSHPPCMNLKILLLHKLPVVNADEYLSIWLVIANYKIVK